MRKVVYNACYGGFNLSDKAVELYCRKKNIEFDKDTDTFGSSCTIYKNKQTGEVISSYDFERHDPVLIEVVEELGSEANGLCSNLAIEEVDGAYRIDEYDGMESVETPDSYDWVQ